MANEKIHEYVDQLDEFGLANNKASFDADALINGVWTSVQVSQDAIRRYVAYGPNSNGQYTGLALPTLTNNEILAIPNPNVGTVVYNLDHDTICFYASNGWQRLNHQPM